MKNHLLTIVFLISISLPQLSPAGEDDVHAVVNGVEFSTAFIVRSNPTPLHYWPKSAVSKKLEVTINDWLVHQHAVEGGYDKEPEFQQLVEEQESYIANKIRETLGRDYWANAYLEDSAQGRVTDSALDAFFTKINATPTAQEKEDMRTQFLVRYVRRQQTRRMQKIFEKVPVSINDKLVPVANLSLEVETKDGVEGGFRSNLLAAAGYPDAVLHDSAVRVKVEAGLKTVTLTVGSQKIDLGDPVHDKLRDSLSVAANINSIRNILATEMVLQTHDHADIEDLRTQLIRQLLRGYLYHKIGLVAETIDISEDELSWFIEQKPEKFQRMRDQDGEEQARKSVAKVMVDMELKEAKRAFIDSLRETAESEYP
jgi:hypothetical protein